VVASKLFFVQSMMTPPTQCPDDTRAISRTDPLSAVGRVYPANAEKRKTFKDRACLHRMVDVEMEVENWDGAIKILVTFHLWIWIMWFTRKVRSRCPILTSEHVHRRLTFSA
jgi:hypothetical protein